MKMWKFMLLLLLLPLGALATPAVRPMSQRGIIFPKESYDDCFMDDAQQLPGVCKKLQDCPTGLHRWQHENQTPKTCYFVKFDHYICCELDKSNLQATKRPTTTQLPDPYNMAGAKRRSEMACFDYNNPKPVKEEEQTFFISVVGGKPTIPNEFPYMAALGWRSNINQNILYRCGGVLISPQYVLTAAHCVEFGGDLPSTVLLGGDNLTLSTNEQFRIRRAIVHPSYKSNTQYNDIALLELDTMIAPKQRPACLWPNSELLNKDLTAIGYGQTQFAGSSSAQLLKVSLSWVSNEQCQPHYPQDILPLGVVFGQLCAGDPIRARDTCQGDSGGPLIMTQGYDFVVGITSLGQGCASGPPSIYTRVSHYIDWIESIVWPTDAQEQQQKLTAQHQSVAEHDFDLRVDV